MTNPESNNQPTIPIERFARALTAFKEHPGQSIKEFLTFNDAQQAMLVGVVACTAGYCNDDMLRMMHRLPKADTAEPQ